MISRSGSSAGRFFYSGFTLVEILVVISLLSVVMLALGAAFRTFAQTEVRLDRRLDVTDEFRIATGFIRTTLSRISVRKPDPPSEPADRKILFAAEAQSAAWIGVMPARYGAGGLYYFRLAVENIDGVNSLVIRFKPCINSATFPNWVETEFRTLAANITSFEVQYQDSRQSPSAWSAIWPHADRPPDRLQLLVQVAGTNWPGIVVAPRMLPGAGDRSSGFVIGGGR
ncbi:MAG: prepilin-type N-terminal cleavage/methylation domain-containing protein [Pseudomonadota bacterium]|nr:prepilin-type N-terminal cleavage/methylation domain-containing protein [Pseudomonadota bacterium]